MGVRQGTGSTTGSEAVSGLHGPLVDPRIQKSRWAEVRLLDLEALRREIAAIIAGEVVNVAVPRPGVVEVKEDRPV